MIYVNIGMNTERLLRHHAQALGQPLESYLRRILEIGDMLPTDDISQASFNHMLDDLAAKPTLSALPADFSRADIYNDHN